MIPGEITFFSSIIVIAITVISHQKNILELSATRMIYIITFPLLLHAWKSYNFLTFQGF